MNSNDFDRMTARFATTTSRRQALKLMAGGILGGAAMAAGFKGAAAIEGGNDLGTWSLPDITTVDYGGVSLVPRQFFIDRGELALRGDVVPVGNLETEPLDTFTAPVLRDTIIVSQASNKLASVNSGVTSDVARGQTETGCEILDLYIGPITLDLLGLVVTTEPIHLNITAEPGEGNLLGNLLCAVAGLLDGNGGALGRLRNLLNEILGLLGLA